MFSVSLTPMLTLRLLPTLVDSCAPTATLREPPIVKVALLPTLTVRAAPTVSLSLPTTVSLRLPLIWLLLSGMLCSAMKVAQC
jgi:hypothetical protein